MKLRLEAKLMAHKIARDRDSVTRMSPIRNYDMDRAMREEKANDLEPKVNNEVFCMVCLQCFHQFK